MIPELAVMRVKPAEPIVFSALQPMKTPQDLLKSLDAMKSKVLPIARDSLEFINEHLAEIAKRTIATHDACDDASLAVRRAQSVAELLSYQSKAPLVPDARPARRPSWAIVFHRGAIQR